MRFLIKNTIATILVLVNVAACLDLPSERGSQNPDAQVAQIVAAARAVTQDVEMDAINFWEDPSLLNYREAIRAGLGVPQATCELRECVEKGIAIVRLNSVHVGETDDEHASVAISWSVPRVEGDGNVEWRSNHFVVRLRRRSDGWRVVEKRRSWES